MTKLNGIRARSTWAQLIEGQPQHLAIAFRYTSNAMYGVAFLGLWGIALLFGSWNALVIALFQHAYIWVHMYCTEAPDMARIYAPKPEIAPDIAKLGPDA